MDPDVFQPKKRNHHPFLWIFGIFALLIILGRLLPRSPTFTVKAPTVTPVVEKPKLPWIKASQLNSDYKSNEVYAERHYKGRVLVITGEVGAVGRDHIETGMFAGVKPYVELNDYGTSWTLDGIQGSVSKEDEDFLSKIKRGQPLALVCTVLGKDSVTGILKADHCRPADQSEIGLPVRRPDKTRAAR